MTWQVLALLLAAGVIGGFLSGLIGIGGGVIYVLVIPYALAHFAIPEQWRAQLIIANSLAAIFFASLAGNYMHYRKGYFFPREVLLISIAAVISAALVQQFVVNTPLFSLKYFLFILIVLMSYMLVYTWRKKANELGTTLLPPVSPSALLMTGLVSGLVAAASGLGGGIIVIPVLHGLFNIPVKKASAIALGVIMISSFTLCCKNLNVAVPQTIGNIGLIIPSVCLLLSFSVIITAPFGVEAAHKFSGRAVKNIYMTVLSILIIHETIILLRLTGQL